MLETYYQITCLHLPALFYYKLDKILKRRYMVNTAQAEGCDHMTPNAKSYAHINNCWTVDRGDTE